MTAEQFTRNMLENNRVAAELSEESDTDELEEDEGSVSTVIE